MSTWKSDMRRPKITTEVATDRKISRDISSIPVRNPIRLINLWGFFSSSQSLYNPRTLPAVAYLLQDLYINYINYRYVNSNRRLEETNVIDDDDFRILTAKLHKYNQLCVLVVASAFNWYSKFDVSHGSSIQWSSVWSLESHRCSWQMMNREGICSSSQFIYCDFIFAHSSNLTIASSYLIVQASCCDYCNYCNHQAITTCKSN